jgi:hypothetical protein
VELMHQLGYAHLDIKPENLYVIEDDRVSVSPRPCPSPALPSRPLAPPSPHPPSHPPLTLPPYPAPCPPRTLPPSQPACYSLWQVVPADLGHMQQLDTNGKVRIQCYEYGSDKDQPWLNPHMMATDASHQHIQGESTGDPCSTHTLRHRLLPSPTITPRPHRLVLPPTPAHPLPHRLVPPPTSTLSIPHLPHGQPFTAPKLTRH